MPEYIYPCLGQDRQNSRYSKDTKAEQRKRAADSSRNKVGDYLYDNGPGSVKFYRYHKKQNTGYRWEYKKKFFGCVTHVY